jgi:hypothetical protein
VTANPGGDAWAQLINRIRNSDASRDDWKAFHDIFRGIVDTRIREVVDTIEVEYPGISIDHEMDRALRRQIQAHPAKLPTERDRVEISMAKTATAVALHMAAEYEEFVALVTRCGIPDLIENALKDGFPGLLQNTAELTNQIIGRLWYKRHRFGADCAAVSSVAGALTRNTASLTNRFLGLRQDDAKAADEIFAELSEEFDRIFKSAFPWISSADRDDIRQNILLKLWRFHGRVFIPGRLNTWDGFCRTVVHNAVFDWLKKRRRDHDE